MTIALEKSFYSEVYLALGEAGIIHLSRFQEREAVADSKIQNEEELTRKIISGTEYALNALMISSGETDASLPPVDQQHDEKFVAGIKKKIERALRLREKLQTQEEIVNRHMEYLDVLNKMGIHSEIFTKAQLVKTAFGTVENAVGDVPSDRTFMLAKMDHYVFGIALPSDYPVMLQFLKDFGFTDKSGDVRPIPMENLRKRGEHLKRRRDVIADYIDHLKNEKGQTLRQLNNTYHAYEEILKAMRMSLFSARAMFITGWMDIRDKEKLVGIMQRICGNRFVLSEQRDRDAPVRLLNMRWLKPFELLVKTMGMPSNNEIDPTPLTAVTFVIMFGLMFGDLGQGIVLILCGILLKKFGRERLKEDLAQAGGILMTCGISAAVCGLLYGSVFSSENIIPALWFHPTAQIMKLFAATILIGVVFIITGMIVNIINNILNADYTEAFLEKRGLAILIIYSVIVFFAINYQTTGTLPGMWQIGAFIFLPLIVFSLRGVLGPAIFQSARPHSIAEYVIETVMDMVEIALSLFANTISFIRVGAFALSHTGLSIVTYTLAGIADPSLKSAGAFIIIIIGNIFIIGFEGLICGIQSMRLEYYEFFSKFFKGEGVIFSPFTLKVKSSEV